jgi:propionyl-CoA carboxylase alpha chain
MAITRVLVANRGEIASRVFRTCRELGLSTVAVFSDADADLPFVREADAAVRLPGSAPADTYLRTDLLLAAAAATGADAVHPGYGFLSEDAGFAQAVVDAGLTWVGPPPEAVRLMGSKLGAKALMAEAGVPCLPGADVTDLAPDALAKAADGVGYPVLVKASAGGGGRGMRVVREPSDLADAVASAQREAASAFGDPTVFLERYVDRPRHVEVQVMADAHGQVVALFERECSLQRRHQKVVEEAPSPAVDEALRARLSEAAVAAARAVGYTGAGTVEFVLSPDGEPSFLEMNTRLQVEHPVTELVTGLDLVALQLLVADGHPLPPAVAGASIRGHAIEVRLYAEDPTQGFLPTSGPLHAFDVPLLPGVRVDAGYESGSVVSTHYDAMLAKVVAHGATRAQAAARLAAALEQAVLDGPTTNRDLLVRTLRSPEFLAGGTDTGFYERHDPAVLGAPLLDDAARGLHAVAAVLSSVAERRAAGGPWSGLPARWRNLPSQDEEVAFVDGPVVAYAFDRDGLRVALDGTPLDGVRLWSSSPAEVDLEVAGVRRRYAVTRRGGSAYVSSSLGGGALTEVDRFPEPGSQLAEGSLVAPMPGTVVRVAAAVGQVVAPGDVVVVLEAMKMEHAVRAGSEGTVAEVAVVAGDQVDSGALLAVVAPA